MCFLLAGCAVFVDNVLPTRGMCRLREKCAFYLRDVPSSRKMCPQLAECAIVVENGLPTRRMCRLRGKWPSNLRNGSSAWKMCFQLTEWAVCGKMCFQLAEWAVCVKNVLSTCRMGRLRGKCASNSWNGPSS